MIKRAGFFLTSLTLLVWVLALAGEAIIRVWNPPPRRVLVDEARVGPLREIEGVPLYQAANYGSPPRIDLLEDLACDPDDAFRVLVLGDSIFNGMGVETELVASRRLKRQLEEEADGASVCVKNLAVSGFSLYQTLARMRAEIDDFSPHIVLLELWGGPPRVPKRLDGRIYFFHGLPIDELGYGNPFGLPASLNETLLTQSKLYEYSVLASPGCSQCTHDLTPHLPLLNDALARIQSVDADLVTFMPASLFFPFDKQPKSIELENEGYFEWIDAHGLRNVPLWERFASLDEAAIRLDGCHLNADGHIHLARVFRDEVAPTFQAWRAARAGD